MQLRLSRLAEADVDGIFEYGLVNHGAAAALAYLDEIEMCYRQLLGYPRSGRRDVTLGAGLHSLSCRAHRIYYELDGDAVIIQRVLHKSMDAERWLG